MPKPHGPVFTMCAYVDADHASNLATCRSSTGFFLFFNYALMYWFSNKQGLLETSTFGSEFYTMKVATEYVRAFHYKLRMMGIPVDEPAFVFGNNKSVLCNTSNIAPTLKKKSNSIAFHHVRDGVVQD